MLKKPFFYKHTFFRRKGMLSKGKNRSFRNEEFVVKMQKYIFQQKRRFAVYFLVFYRFFSGKRNAFGQNILRKKAKKPQKSELPKIAISQEK
jgi:hypothetical protein